MSETPPTSDPVTPTQSGAPVEAKPTEAPAVAPEPPALPNPAPAPTQTTALPAHRIDRLTTIVVALIAVFGVLAGGLVAAASSWWTAKVTTESNRSIEFEKFRRQEVEKAYLGYIADIQNFSLKAADVDITFIDRKDPDWRPFALSEKTTAMLKAQSDLDNSTHLIELVGSATIRDGVERVRLKVSELSHIAASALEAWYDKTRDRKAEDEKNALEYNQAYLPFHGQVQDIINSMRDDLNIADHKLP